MPYPTPYDVPEEARKMALYQSLLGMGSQMLQPKPYKTGLMGDIGNVFGAANQGMSNMGSLLGSYQKTLQEQEAMKLKQAEDMRQQQQLDAQIPLIQAQTQNQLRQAEPEQLVPLNGMQVPLSKFSSLLGAVTGAQELARKTEESRNTGIGMQNLGILQNLRSNTEGMSPENAAIAEGSIREQAMRYAPKETQDYLKGMKPSKQIERTVDLGDNVEYIYTDGTRESKKKGITPSTQFRIDTGEGTKDSRFAMNLRKEFNGLQPIKDYRDVTTKFNVMGKAFDESKKTSNFTAVDQALITLYNKMTDPQSVVRESEYIRTPEDMAVMDRIKATMSRIGKGGRLEPNTRQAIMTMAEKFKATYEAQYNAIADEYRGYARQAGIEPSMVIPSPKIQTPTDQQDGWGIRRIQ